MKVKDIQPRHAENVTQDVIKAWKEAYPRGIWEMTVFARDDEEKNKIGYFRKPTRVELSASSSLQVSPVEIAEDLLRTCWLGGDEELINDDDYFTDAVEQFQELMKTRKGEIKKL